jgi:glycosyltransferase involved in cell wall biosynthesis
LPAPSTPTLRKENELPELVLFVIGSTRKNSEWYKGSLADVYGLTILSVAYPLFPVGPDSSGGAEQILSLLDREIVRSGGRSLVIGATGSTVAGQLVATPSASGLMTDAAREDAHQQHRAAIKKTLDQQPVDLIHFHGLDFDSYAPDADVPMLATLHLPIAWYPPSAFARDNVRLICVSQSQAAGTGLPVVPNGIDIGRYGTAAKQDYLLWMGRICPEKGVHIALEVAHALDMHLLIAGPVHSFESHRNYFDQRVMPLLDEHRRYLGPAAGEEKSRLIAGARCLLIPSLVAETSSLVAMEAISSGTPVIAFSHGALPEVVDHRKTGFIVNSPSEMAEAVTRIGTISPEVCRSTATARFAASRMACDYFKLYSSLARSR